MWGLRHAEILPKFNEIAAHFCKTKANVNYLWFFIYLHLLQNSQESTQTCVEAAHTVFNYPGFLNTKPSVKLAVVFAIHLHKH